MVMDLLKRNAVTRPDAMGTNREPRRWPAWTRPAAMIWTLIYGALGVYWSLGGAGFPLGVRNDPDAEDTIYSQATAAIAAPFIAILCFLGVIALCLCKRNARGLTRMILIAYGWGAATILCFTIMDSRALITLAYTPIYLAGAPFGLPLDRYFDFITWPVVNQFVCAAGGMLWGATVLYYQRASRGACGYCGRNGNWRTTSGSAVRWGKRVTYLAILAPAYYDITRLAWLLGIPLGVSNALFESLWSTGAVWAGAGLALVSIGGAFLTQGLIKPWGETLPRWFPYRPGKRVPPALVIVPAMFVSIMFTVTGIQIVLGFSFSNGMADWGASTPLLLYPVWGIALGAATIFYYYRRRGCCHTCGES